MAKREKKGVGLILDANVVIDYVCADESILALVSKHLGPAAISAPLLKEVEQLDRHGCQRLGLKLLEPAFAQLVEATQNRGALSFEDRLCLVVARDLGVTCVTNDKRLRTACGEDGVVVLWGLELMHQLVGMSVLTPEGALEVATSIHANNPFHISTKVLDAFRRKLR